MGWVGSVRHIPNRRHPSFLKVEYFVLATLIGQWKSAWEFLEILCGTESLLWFDVFPFSQAFMGYACSRKWVLVSHVLLCIIIILLRNLRFQILCGASIPRIGIFISVQFPSQWTIDVYKKNTACFAWAKITQWKQVIVKCDKFFVPFICGNGNQSNIKKLWTCRPNQFSLIGYTSTSECKSIPSPP